MDQFFHCTSKKLLTLKNSKKYLSKLAYITLSHRFTDLSCECKNVVQTCPELTLFLPIYIWISMKAAMEVEKVADMVADMFKIKFIKPEKF